MFLRKLYSFSLRFLCSKILDEKKKEKRQTNNISNGQKNGKEIKVNKIISINMTFNVIVPWGFFFFNFKESGKLHMEKKHHIGINN